MAEQLLKGSEATIPLDPPASERGTQLVDAEPRHTWGKGTHITFPFFGRQLKKHLASAC